MLYALSGLRKEVKLFCMSHELANIADLKRWGNVFDLCSEEKSVEASGTIDRLEKAIEKLQVRAISPNRPSFGRSSPSPVRQVRFADGPDNGPGQFGRQPDGRDRRDGPTSTPFAQRGGTFTRPFRGAFRGPRRSAGRFYSSNYTRPPPPQSENFAGPSQQPQFENPRFDSSTQQRNIACRNCGRFHVWGACMARDRQCFHCGKLHHFASVCRNRPQQ